MRRTWPSSSAVPARVDRTQRRLAGLVVAQMVLAAGVAVAQNANLTLLAPSRVTDKTRVEARLGIANPTSQPVNYSVEMFLDSSLGSQTLTTTNVVVPPGAQQLVSHWFPTTGLGGHNQVRYRLTAAGGDIDTGAQKLSVVASDTRAVPLISAAWIDPGAVLPGVYPSARATTAADLRDSVDAAHAVGIDTLIITYSEYILNGWGAFYPSPTLGTIASFDVVGTVLDQASKNGQKVFVGLGRGDDLLLTYTGLNDPTRLANGLAHSTTVANELWDLYGDEPSFYGWYLTHEAADLGGASQAFYNPLTETLREFAVEKPVLISPSGTPVMTSATLAASEVDVFAYQDAVGAGYIPYVYTYDPQQRIDTLDAVFSSYAAKHQGVDKHLWANLENWQMDGPTYGNPYPAQFARVLEQLEIEKHYVDVISSYEWLGFMEHPESTARLGGPAAMQLYEDYRDYYEQINPTLKTVNYAVNSGFELPTNSNVPTGWQPSREEFASFVSATNSDTPTGTAAALSLDVNSAEGLNWLQQDIPVAAGNEYQFSLWAKMLEQDPAGGHLAAQVWMLPDSESGTILSSTALYFSGGEWDFQSSTITAPAGAGIARLVLAVQTSQFASGTGHYLVDGVALVGAAGEPGDYDGNGVVDANDYLVWKSSLGSSIDLRADGNGDQVVDLADYVVWRDRAGSGATPAAAANAAVPEPANGIAAGLLAAWLAVSRCRLPRRAGLAAVVAVAAIVMPAGSSNADERPDSATVVGECSSSMTLIPPVPVTTNVEVEVRVAVRNLSSDEGVYRLRVWLDRKDDETVLVEKEVSLPPHGDHLSTHRLATKPYAGLSRIRYSLTRSDGLQQDGSWPLQVVPCETRAVPLLQMGWIEPGAMTPDGYEQQSPPSEQSLRAAIDRYHDIGFGGFIIAYPEAVYSGGGFYYPTRVFADQPRAVDFDVVGTILSQASRNGQHVFLGLGRGPDLHLTWTGFDDEARNQAAIAHSTKVATEFWAMYGHEPSFYGWYLSHEANDIARASRSYYNGVTRFLKTFEADKPVLISPSGTPLFENNALDETLVDILAYQDAVGSGYVPYENTFDPGRRIAMLPEVFASYANAHRDSPRHLWGNLETWQMDGPQYNHAYPAPFDRVLQQLEIQQQHVDVITAYALPGFLEPPESEVELGGSRAKQLFANYAEYFQQVTDRLQMDDLLGESN